MIILRYIDMVYSVKAFTVLDDDDNYNIYINSRYAEGIREDSLRHEMQHIKNGDFLCSVPAHLIERTMQ